MDKISLAEMYYSKDYKHHRDIIREIGAHFSKAKLKCKKSEKKQDDIAFESIILHSWNVLNTTDAAALKNELTTLLESVQLLLDKSVSDFATSSDCSKALAYDSKKLLIRNLQKEISSLEFIISVVGSMKSGKSTFVKSLVGGEVAPSRVEPMTILPCALTHVPGKKDPSLTIPQSLLDIVNECQQQIRIAGLNSSDLVAITGIYLS